MGHDDVPPDANPGPERTWVWGVPFSRVRFAETVALVERMISLRRPRFLITANLHYVMLSAGDARLRANNERAALVLADGMPIVWASRWRGQPLPERVTGSDLFPMLCARAAERGYRVFFLGAAPGVAAEAAQRLQDRHPGLKVVGFFSPPFRDRSDAEEAELRAQIRSARPDLLFVAFGQPKGEYWVADAYEDVGAPVTIQVGASIDFVAGRVRRAPKWMQRFGLEWLYRFVSEPKRLGGRYTANAWFAARMLLRDVFTRRHNRR